MSQIKIEANNIQIVSPDNKVFFSTLYDLGLFLPYMRSKTVDVTKSFIETQTGKVLIDRREQKFNKKDHSEYVNAKVTIKEIALGNSDGLDKIAENLENGKTVTINDWKLKVVQYDRIKR